MLILGIDPGYDLIGFGLIERQDGGMDWHYCDGGVIRTSKELDYWDRIGQLANDLDSLLAEYKPSACAIESVFFTKNVKTAIKVAQARGVIGWKMQKNAIPIFEYTPSQVKLALTSQGKAEKWQVQEMVQRLLHLDAIPQPDDFADALAIALCHGQSWQLGCFL